MKYTFKIPSDINKELTSLAFNVSYNYEFGVKGYELTVYSGSSTENMQSVLNTVYSLPDTSYTECNNSSNYRQDVNNIVSITVPLYKDGSTLGDYISIEMKVNKSEISENISNRKLYTDNKKHKIVIANLEYVITENNVTRRINVVPDTYTSISTNNTGSSYTNKFYPNVVKYTGSPIKYSNSESDKYTLSDTPVNFYDLTANPKERQHKLTGTIRFDFISLDSAVEYFLTGEKYYGPAHGLNSVGYLEQSRINYLNITVKIKLNDIVKYTISRDINRSDILASEGFYDIVLDNENILIDIDMESENMNLSIDYDISVNQDNIQKVVVPVITRYRNRVTNQATIFRRYSTAIEDVFNLPASSDGSEKDNDWWKEFNLSINEHINDLSKIRISSSFINMMLLSTDSISNNENISGYCDYIYDISEYSKRGLTYEGCHWSKNIDNSADFLYSYNGFIVTGDEETILPSEEVTLSGIEIGANDNVPVIVTSGEGAHKGLYLNFIINPESAKLGNEMKFRVEVLARSGSSSYIISSQYVKIIFFDKLECESIKEKMIYGDTKDRDSLCDYICPNCGRIYHLYKDGIVGSNAYIKSVSSKIDKNIRELKSDAIITSANDIWSYDYSDDSDTVLNNGICLECGSSLSKLSDYADKFWDKNGSYWAARTIEAFNGFYNQKTIVTNNGFSRNDEITLEDFDMLNRGFVKSIESVNKYVGNGTDSKCTGFKENSDLNLEYMSKYESSEIKSINGNSNASNDLLNFHEEALKVSTPQNKE